MPAKLNVISDRSPPVADFPRCIFWQACMALTAYDVAYLDLGKRLSLPLATRR
jgi:hypothetical protein